MVTEAPSKYERLREMRERAAREDKIDADIARKRIAEIDTSDIPESGDKWFKKAKLVMPVSKPANTKRKPKLRKRRRP